MIFRIALRRFLARPVHTAVMIAVLTLGIGASTAVFTVVDQTILRSPPFIHPDRLVDVFALTGRRGGGGNQFTPDKILGWQAQPEVFERFEAYAPRDFDVTREAEPERIQGLMVSLGLFEMLGVRPRLGRAFAQGDGRPGSERVVIISDGLWRRRFGGEAEVLGRRLVLNDEDYTIVGVMPRRFVVLRSESVWLPFDVKAHQGNTSESAFQGLGRLRTGLTAAAAQSLSESTAENMQQVQPIPRSWFIRLDVRRVARVDPSNRRGLLVLLGAVGFLLLITCANVANLFLTRAAARHREMAIRSALGAGRGRLVRGVLAEGLLLAAAGGALGVVLAQWGIGLVVALAPSTLTFMTRTSVEIDGRILAAAGASTVLIGLVFALGPALRASRPEIEATLRSGGDRQAGKSSYGRVPGALVIAEVALSLILLVGAALLLRTLGNLESISPGFQPAGLVSMEIALPSDRYFGGLAHARFFESLSERIRTLPGVSDVAMTSSPPPSVGGITFGVPETETGPVANGQRQTVPNGPVSPDFFRVLEIPILEGRTFTPGEPGENVIVSKAIAELFWPGGRAIGKHFRLGSDFPWWNVIGIAGNIEARAAGDELYQPYCLLSLDRHVARAGRETAGTAPLQL